MSTSPSEPITLPHTPSSLQLELTIQDEATIQELLLQPLGEGREQYALDALRIGVLALKQARGQIDADAVRRESERMLESLDQQLVEHSRVLNERLSLSLKEYFDPHDGRLTERVDRLVKQDGELEQILRKQIGSEDSELLKTLTQTVGEQSPLLKMLSPDQSNGLLATLRKTVEQELEQQREKVLGQFSLDNKESALSRFISELHEKQGEFSENLHERIDLMTKEFSLDQEDSALNRLLNKVNDSHRTITSQFSFDDEQSALSRLKKTMDETHSELHGQLSLDDEKSALSILKRELSQLLEETRESNLKFQEEVKLSLQEMVVRKKESEKSTQHGLVFEDAVCEYFFHQSQNANDIATRTGNTTGQIRNCKVGDCVIQLGKESAAPDTKIVIEAKEASNYNLEKALEESETARKNREAQIGIFVFSQKSAPAGLEPLNRYGDDLIVIWDAEDPSSDVYLKVALSMAKALCVRQKSDSEESKIDFTEIDKALLEIEKRTNNLEEITKAANTITNGAERIRKNVENSQKSLLKQLDTLRQTTHHIKQILTHEES